MQEGQFEALISKEQAPSPLDVELWTRLGNPKCVTLKEPAASVSFGFVFNDQGRILVLEGPAVKYHRTESSRIASSPYDGSIRFVGRRWNGTVDVIHIFGVQEPSHYYLAKGAYCLGVEMDAPYSEEDSGVCDKFVPMGWRA